MILNHKNGGHFVQHICLNACLLTTPHLLTSRLMKMAKKTLKKQHSSEKGSLTLFWPMHHQVTNKAPWITAEVLVSSIKTGDFKFHLHLQVQSSDVIFIPSCFQLNKDKQKYVRESCSPGVPATLICTRCQRFYYKACFPLDFWLGCEIGRWSPTLSNVTLWLAHKLSVTWQQ